MGRDVHRILAVDADPASIALLNELLNPATFDLVTAASAEQALKLLAEEKRPFDLMVIDRMLPGMNGAALLRRIRSFSRFKDVPAVMQTTFASPLQVREGLAAGAAYYLLKPLDADCLSAIIRGALNDVNERRCGNHGPTSPSYAASALPSVRTLATRSIKSESRFAIVRTRRANTACSCSRLGRPS